MRHFLILVICLLFLASCFAQKESKKYFLPEIGILISIPSDLKLAEVTTKTEYLDSNGDIITDTAQIRLMKSTDTNAILDLASKDGKIKLGVVMTPFHKDLVSFMGDTSDGFKNFRVMAINTAKNSAEKFDSSTAKINIGNFTFEKFLLVTYNGNNSLYSGTYLTRPGNFYITIGFNCNNKLMADRLQLIIESAKAQ